MKGILIICIALNLSLEGQTAIDTTALISQLESMRTRDQKTRVQGDSVAFIQQIDSANLAQLEKIIAQIGWPGKSLVGARGNNTAFLIVQHAELAAQLTYVPLLRQSVAIGESDPADLALLEDRILMRQGKPQIYGSQVVSDPATGGWKFWDIEDEIHVNERRAQVGLMPIEEYATYFGIRYIAPKE